MLLHRLLNGGGSPPTNGQFLLSLTALASCLLILVVGCGPAQLPGSAAAASAVVKPAGASVVTAIRPDDEGTFFLRQRDDFAELEEREYEDLFTFCFRGEEAHLPAFWKSVAFRLRHDANDDFSLLSGPNATAVHENWLQSKSGFVTRLLRMPWRTEHVRVSPFEDTCVGVVTREKFRVTLLVYRINFWQVAMTVAGLAMFLYAPTLCRNVFFHYSTGVAAGILFSLLVVTFFVQKRVRAGWMSWILGFYSISLYLMTSLWYNLKTYLLDNQSYVLGYLLVTGIASFALCYRLGPVDNPRTLNLIQWSLQLSALVLVYVSSYYTVASTAVCIGAVTWAAIPQTWKTNAQIQYHRRFFKPKAKLLDEQEYLDQSRVETERALTDLREFCKSPKCNTWKTVSQLTSPNRFAEFIEGSSHLTQEEVMEYSSADLGDWSDDERDVTDDESGSEDVNLANEDRSRT